MSNQPVVINIQYTPYRLPKSATSAERAAHADERAFYDMTGTKNIFDYITTEEKQTGRRTKKLTAFEYLQKTAGVFNDKGVIPKEQVAEMKARLKDNKGNIWHGFISLNEEESHKIDTPEKCIELVKRTLPQFFTDAKLGKENIDLMCALHMDRPKHLHIHFVFWEKEPKYKDKSGRLQYRRRGRIEKKAIDNLFVRTALFLDGDRERLYKARDEAIGELRKLTHIKRVMSFNEEVQKEILALAEDLPKTGRLSYGSKDMEPYRERVDGIVRMLLSCDGRARKANLKFYQAVEKRKSGIGNICGTQPFAFSVKNVTASEMESNLPKYHNKIDEKNIRIVEDLEADYKRRQGNLVLNLAKYIKPELYKSKKTKPNDKTLKRHLAVSRKIVNRACKQFFSTFGRESEMLERDFSHRLQDIEEGIERERKQQDKERKEEDYKN